MNNDIAITWGVKKISICIRSPSARNPLFGFTFQGDSVDRVNRVSRFPTFLTSTTLEEVHLTGALDRVISSGRSITPIVCNNITKQERKREKEKLYILYYIDEVEKKKG